MAIAHVNCFNKTLQKEVGFLALPADGDRCLYCDLPGDLRTKRPRWMTWFACMTGKPIRM